MAIALFLLIEFILVAGSLLARKLTQERSTIRRLQWIPVALACVMMPPLVEEWLPATWDMHPYWLMYVLAVPCVWLAVRPLASREWFAGWLIRKVLPNESPGRLNAGRSGRNRFEKAYRAALKRELEAINDAS